MDPEPGTGTASHLGPLVNFIPIADVTPYTSYTIRARVTLKTQIIPFKNSKGDGQVFNFNLIDESGEIRACCFNEEVNRFYNMIEVNQVFFISKFNLRPANRQFNNLNHEFEMLLNKRSTITPCLMDTEDIPTQTFDFIKIEDIEQKPESSIVDIIGICKRVADISKVTQRSTNRELTKRDITLVDRSNKEINVTLWGKQAEDFKDTSQSVIAIKGAKVSDFNGKSVSLLMSSVFAINPSIKETHDLRSWYDTDGHKEQTISLTIDGRHGGGGIVEWKSLNEANSYELESLDMDYFFKAKVTIKCIKENIYKGCVQVGCYKKVVDQLNFTYYCESCSKVMYSFKYRMILDVSFYDITDDVWATCFQNVGELILDTKTEDLGKWKDQEPQSLDKAIQNALYKSYNVKFRTKLEDYNDGTFRKTTAVFIDVN